MKKQFQTLYLACIGIGIGIGTFRRVPKDRKGPIYLKTKLQELGPWLMH